LRLDDDVFEDFVQCVSEMDMAVGVRRPVVQHELRRALPLLANAAVEVHRVPARNRFRLDRLQIGFHRKTCARQVHRVFPLGHAIKLYPDAATYNAGVGARSEGSDGRVYDEVLDNGLRVLVQEVRTAPLASVWCWYRVGSKNESPGLTGVSHWVEHMNFKGTTNIPRDKVKGIIEQFGGYWNGYTWIDQTTYTETASRDALDRMLFIESERMTNCLYDPADCESERTVIISELQGGENDPDQLLDQELTATAFKAHPYRHPTIGWLPDLQTMTRDDLYGYYRRHYLPNNATLVIVGDVDTDDVLRNVERRCGPIVAGPRPERIRTSEPEQVGERRVTIRKEGTTAYLRIGFHAPAAADSSFAAALLLDAVLSGAKGVNLW